MPEVTHGLTEIGGIGCPGTEEYSLITYACHASPVMLPLSWRNRTILICPLIVTVVCQDPVVLPLAESAHFIARGLQGACEAQVRAPLSRRNGRRNAGEAVPTGSRPWLIRMKPGGSHDLTISTATSARPSGLPIHHAHAASSLVSVGQH